MMHKTREEKRAALVKHYEKSWRKTSYQHMLDLDDEFREVNIFGDQCISAEVGPGWAQLLRPVLTVLRDNGCTAGQIKQKFGGLRFYWNYPDHMELAADEWRKANAAARDIDRNAPFDVPFPFEDERILLNAIIGPIVAEAELLSFGTCEECGVTIDPPRPAGWRTECNSCNEKANALAKRS